MYLYQPVTRVTGFYLPVPGFTSITYLREMKCILLFGAGKSATVLIDYLKELASDHQWKVIVADSNLAAANEKVGLHSFVHAAEVDINDETQRQALIQQADVVISLMPPALHYFVAVDCLALQKHLLTASYVDDRIKALANDIQQKDLLFLCEMGLDPGIDHMSAMQLVHRITSAGGRITSFKSHCGGLIAPESDDNPWHYKISWNPRNIVLAGKAGAVYLEDGEEKQEPYESLFSVDNQVAIPALDTLVFYPNRDSLSYIPVYKMEGVKTFIRTTLRHPEFCFGWKNIVDLKLTSEEKVYETDGMSFRTFFKTHFDNHGFSGWLNNMLSSRLDYAKQMMEKLTQLMEAEEEAAETGEETPDEVLMVDDKGELNTFNIEEIKDSAAESVAYKMHEANLSMKQLFFLGLEDETLINKGLCSAADVLQLVLENKLALQPSDKDMIVMLHEFEYILNEKTHHIKSCLIVKGEDAVHTGMAKTVGLPLGIAAKLILENKITVKGLHIPVIPGIYEPVLTELAARDIRFTEYES